MSEQEQMLSYQDLLKHLKERGGTNHLLLGNGFNNSLLIKTDYKSIFNEMVGSYSNYKDVERSLGENYDIEYLVAKLKLALKDEGNSFLSPFITNKVKLDFMKAACSLVNKKIKTVYQEKNAGIYLLLQNFTNYFTLNYDPLLYLLLLKFKDTPNSQAVALQQLKHYFPNDKEERLEILYKLAKDAYEKGIITTQIGAGGDKRSEIRQNPKSLFQEFLKHHSKQDIESHRWTNKEINNVIKKILQEEPNKSILKVNDGFKSDGLFKELESELDLPKAPDSQNLFFLHGCFHIVEDKERQKFRKITQTQNKAFREKLEEIINSEEEDIVCIFEAQSDEKLNQIENNAYLQRCFDRLGNISGNLVIFGCSFSENDAHIFNQLQKSSVENLYVSTCKEGLSKIKKAVGRRIQGMQVMYFDYDTVSYEPPRSSCGT